MGMEKYGEDKDANEDNYTPSGDVSGSLPQFFPRPVYKAKAPKGTPPGDDEAEIDKSQRGILTRLMASLPYSSDLHDLGKLELTEIGDSKHSQDAVKEDVDDDNCQGDVY